MVLYVVDPFQESHFNVLNRELEISGMRLNEARPPVFVVRTDRGGIIVRSTCEQTHLDKEEVQDIVRSFGIVSAHVTMRIDATADHLVDTMAANRVYSKAVIVVNKMDIASEKDLARTTDNLPEGWPVMPISAFTGMGVEDMKDFLYDNLGFMSIYLKPQGQEADLIEPLIVKDTSTVEDVCVTHCTVTLFENFDILASRDHRPNSIGSGSDWRINSRMEICFQSSSDADAWVHLRRRC